MSTPNLPMPETEFRKGCAMVQQGHVEKITFFAGHPILNLRFKGPIISTASFLLMQGNCGHNCPWWRAEICEPVGTINDQNQPVIELNQGLIQIDP